MILTVKNGKPNYLSRYRMRKAGNMKFESSRSNLVLKITDEEIQEAAVELWNSIYPDWL